MVLKEPTWSDQIPQPFVSANDAKIMFGDSPGDLMLIVSHTHADPKILSDSIPTCLEMQSLDFGRASDSIIYSSC